MAFPITQVDGNLQNKKETTEKGGRCSQKHRARKSTPAPVKKKCNSNGTASLPGRGDVRNPLGSAKGGKLRDPQIQSQGPVTKRDAEEGHKTTKTATA